MGEIKMNRNKIIAVALATITATSLIATTPAFATPKFSSGNHNGSGLEEVNSGNQFLYFVINGKVIANADPLVKGGVTFVSAPDILDALGIEYTTSKAGGNKLTVNVDGNEYVFMTKTGKNTYYTKNGEKIYNKVVEQNGVKAPENLARNVMHGDGTKMFVPLSFFTKELGYSDIFSVDDNWCLNMGEGANLPTSGGDVKDNFITGEKANKNKTIAEGWVCPTLQSVSKDNVVEDARTLIKELEFDENGSTSAIYKPQGTKGVSVGPFAFGTDASHFSAIRIYDYNTNMFEASAKNDKIIPQVFKFYFPNSWQKVDEIYKAGGGASRYTIDGRDTVIDPNGVIFFSKVGGSLSGYLASNYASKGVIGSAYNVQTSNTGFWINYGGSNWYYKLSDMSVAKNWKQINSKWYYFNQDGVMQTGWLKDGSNWYYLYSDGSMASNTTVSGYKIGSDGAWIR